MPIIFEPPQALCAAPDRPEIWIASSGGTDWGGCQIWSSLDDITYTYLGNLISKSNHGVLTDLLPDGASPDTVNTLKVSLAVSQGVLDQGTEDDANALKTLCYVGGEYIAYRDATLTGAFTYDLRYLVRGAYGSTIASHSAGAAFVRLNNVFKFAYPFDYSGRIVYIKLVSFNIYGKAIQDISQITPYTYTVGGSAITSTGLLKKISSGAFKAAEEGVDYITPGEAGGTYVPKTRKVNGHELSSDVTVSKGDVGLGNVSNDLQIPLYVGTDVQDPTGFVDRDNIGVSYDSTNRTITLTHSSGSIDYYFNSVKKSLVSPWTSSAHTNSFGKYFLYSTDGINFAWSTTAWSYFHVMGAIANYQSSDKFGLREVHGVMPHTCHEENHDRIGTYLKSGGIPTVGTYAENTATNAATTPGFDAAIVKDEDLSTPIPAWTEGTYTTMRIGVSSAVTFDTAASYPFRESGSYILVNNPSTGAETAASTGQYVNVYQILVPVTEDVGSQKYRMLMLQPQATFSSLLAAQSEDPRSLSLGTFTTYAPESVFYTRITYILGAADTNAGKCRIATGGISFVAGSRASQTNLTGFVAPSLESVLSVGHTTTQDIEFLNSSIGPILTDSGGGRWRLIVTTAGRITLTQL